MSGRLTLRAAANWLRGGISVTLLVIIALELLAHTRYVVVIPAAVLVLVVIYAAMRDGLASGMFAATLGVGFIFHFNVSHRATIELPSEWRLQAIASIVLPVSALLVGTMRARLNRVLEDERGLRAAADRERMRSQAILDTMTDGFLSFAPDWTILEANRQAERILGVPREKLIGENGFALFPHAFGSSIHQAIASAVDAGATIEFEDYHPPTQRWFEARVYPRGSEFSVYFRDVTKRHRTQEAIHFQTRLLDALGQAVIATDLNGTIVYWNKVCESLLGWSRDEVVAKAGIAMIHHAYSNVDDARLYGRIRAGIPWVGEAQITTKNGKSFVAAVADTPIHDDDGALIGMVRIITDLTKRKSIEEQQRFLAEAGAKLASKLDAEATIAAVARLAVPTLADCCLVDLVDEDGSIRRLEAAHVDPRKEQIAREISKRYPLEPNSHHPVVDVIRTGEPRLIGRLSDQVLRSIAFDSRHLGMMRDLAYDSGMIVPLIAHGRVLGALSLLSTESKRDYSTSDLTVAEELARRAASAIENARLYEAAVVASRAKSDFLAVMSHELRTPLTTIMGYTDLLLVGVPQKLEDKTRNYVERIRTAAWHLLGIIEQILIYARIEVGREKLQPQTVALRDVVRDAVLLIEPVAAEKGIQFRVGEPPGQTIETDVTKLRQILVNLLANAVKFTDDGEVSLTTTVEGPAVRFVVSDTGIGIAPEHLDRIFDPFWQVDQSATRNVGGTGLGLSVVRRLARLLGGEVTVASEAGGGASFTVQLPLRWGEAASAAASLIAGYIPNRKEGG